MSLFGMRRKRSKLRTSAENPSPEERETPYEPFFGENTSVRRGKKGNYTESPNIRDNGEKILLKFIKNRLGIQAEGLAIRLMNKNPIKDGMSFSYNINQSTEGKSRISKLFVKNILPSVPD